MVTGISRYLRLWEHVANPLEYMLNRGKRRKRDLIFTTQPLPIRFQVPDSLYLVFKELFLGDVYEINDLVSRLPAKPVVIDVGANAGFFVIQLLSKIKEAHIYAYEPIQANIDRFTDTLEQNGRLKQSVQLFPLAVTGEFMEKLDLFAQADDKSQVVASRFTGFDEGNIHALSVSCITLSEIIEGNELGKVDLLKLDCEGSEYDILYNTPAHVLQRIDRMWIEVHDIDQERNNIKALEPFVQSLGYKTTRLRINTFCHALEAVRG